MINPRIFKSSLGHIFKKLIKVSSEHSNVLFACGAVAGLISTVACAIRDTKKADDICAELELSSTKDIVRETWKCYIPTAIMGVSTVTCIIGGAVSNARKIAAITGLYEITEEAYSNYKKFYTENNREVVYSDDEAKIVQTYTREVPLLTTNFGDDICFDPLTGNYFLSCIEAIRKAQNDCLEKINSDIDGMASQNDFYEALGLPTVQGGDDRYWWGGSHTLDISFDTSLTINGRPCICICYSVEPLPFI